MIWNKQTRKYYQNLGYIFTNFGDTFLVDIKDVTKGCKAKVKVKCDYCGKEIEMTYQNYNKCIQNCNKNACSDCRLKKVQEIILDKYGVNTPFEKEEFRESTKKTVMKKYGVKCVSQNKSIKNKIKDTCLKKYGNTSYLQSDSYKQYCKDNFGNEEYCKTKDFHDKVEKISMEKYHCKHLLQNKDIIEKRKKTTLLKYGYEWSCQSPLVRQKSNETLYKNNKIKTSSQQMALYNILKEKYGECKLNYPCGNCFLDCVVSINDVLIDCEYDGDYWHQDESYDRRRDEFVKSNGYKVFRILGNHKPPKSEDVINGIESLINTDHNFLRIDIR